MELDYRTKFVTGPSGSLEESSMILRRNPIRHALALRARWLVFVSAVTFPVCFGLIGLAVLPGMPLRTAELLGMLSAILALAIPYSLFALVKLPSPYPTEQRRSRLERFLRP